MNQVLTVIFGRVFVLLISFLMSFKYVLSQIHNLFFDIPRRSVIFIIVRNLCIKIYQAIYTFEIFFYVAMNFKRCIV